MAETPYLDVKRVLTFNPKDSARHRDIEDVHPRSVSLA